MKNSFLLIILLVFTIIKTDAQNLPPEVENGYTSFTMSGQFGNIPVNMATGAPSINIPIWTASSGSLSVPVSAGYSTNGLRSSDVPSELGLHWNLYAGGSIQQIVRGKSNMGVPENQTDILNPDNNFLYQVNSGTADSEPDIFKVNAPGLSFDFIIAEDTSFLMLTDSRVKIELISNQYWYRGYKITTDDGTKYYFNKRKTATYIDKSQGTSKCTYLFSWLLTKIENSNQTDSIVFNYYDFDDWGKIGRASCRERV